MFWSKIWFFVVAALSALGIGISLATPRPAERKVLEAEDSRLSRARWGVETLLRSNARDLVDVALGFARQPIYADLKKVKDDSEPIPQPIHDSARATLDGLLQNAKGEDKPEFLIAIDASGRVVARSGVDSKEWGDDLSGYFLVRDALRGFMRDDLWLVGDDLYRVAAAPVIVPGSGEADAYVGAIVVGQQVDDKLAKALEVRVSSHCPMQTESTMSCDSHIAFFARGEVIANSGATTLASDIKQEFQKRRAELAKTDDKGNPVPLPPFTVSGESASYRVAIKRLPGEVGAQDGFFAVFSERPKSVGFFGTLRSISKEDMGFGRFPWVALGFGFIVVVAGGLALMWWESERPLRQLAKEAIALGKGDVKSLSEDYHGGKHGSIARSVNLAMEKLAREGKPARNKDLGAVLSPDEPSGQMEARAVAAGPPPSSLPEPTPPPYGGFEFPAPPPPAPLLPPPPPPGPPPSRQTMIRVAVPPPVPSIAPDLPLPPAPRGASAPARMPSPPPMMPPPSPPPTMPMAGPPLTAIEDDVLGGLTPVPSLDDSMPSAASSSPLMPDPPDAREAAYYRQVYEDFFQLKRKCGESTDGLTYDKFSAKLRQNRDQLMAKYACKSVKFQVYVKDGKAALKATPVKA